MDDAHISEDVKILLRDHVESYEKLEILRLLEKQADVSWTCQQVAERLNLPLGLAEEALEGLRASGILDAGKDADEGTLRLLPRSPALRETVERLLRGYEAQPLDIIRCMNANAIERIRNSAIQTFADAFVLRKSKKDG